MKKHFALILILLAYLSACGGASDSQENSQGDSESGSGSTESETMNQGFSGNKIDLEEGKDPCDYLDKGTIAQVFGVAEENVRFKSNQINNCFFYVTFDVKGDYGQGDFSIIPDTGNDNWKEQFDFRKRRVSENKYVEDLGKLAFWEPKKQTLSILFEGYLLVVKPALGRALLEKDNLELAIKIARESGFVD